MKARRRYKVDCCTGKNGCMERTVATAKVTQFPRAGEHPPPGAVSTEHPSRTAIGQHSDVFNPSLLLPKNTPEHLRRHDHGVGAKDASEKTPALRYFCS